ncbi:MAG: hypothetical protein KatS3mg130_0970 [Candidatus Sumerlaea sp.]|jgi:GT2 family glycosyltransferase|nr:MAG: hypothetical protein KatS3mg130_0970 [Candidatus Sumerlaea sp.]
MAPCFSVIIPNWNGGSFLGRSVAATVLSARLTKLDHEIIVMDDASSDGSADEIEQRWPEVSVERNVVNMGFGATVNRGAQIARGEFIVLLNNDLIPREGMLSELIEPLLNHPDLFGVSGKTVEWYTSAPNHVNMAGRLVQGRFVLCYEDSKAAGPTMFLQGGSCAMRRAEFLRLGGFHHLFAPGYWEDYDISYLALKAGWRLWYNPRALGSHLGQGSMVRAYGHRRLSHVRKRNYFLFQWLNFTDRAYIESTCRRLPKDLSMACRQSWIDFRAFCAATHRLTDIEKERARRAPLIQRSDSEIFQEFAHHGELCPEYED